MGKITVEEALKMRGTEFIYVVGKSNDCVRCYVREFTVEKGLSCFALELVSGYRCQDLSHFQDEEDDTFCVIGLRPADLDEALDVLTEIRDTGEFQYKETGNLSIGGSVHCPYNR